MFNVVISFHASMSMTDWKGRELKSLFPNPGVETLFIDGGSTFPCKALDPPTPPPTPCIKHNSPDCPNGKCTTYNDLIRWPTMVPRSPADPKYKADDPTTHKRKSRLQGFVEHFHPKLKNQRYRVAIIGFSEGCGGVGAFLKTTDIGYIDTAVAIDGIHWGKKEKGCGDNSECMRASAAPWLTFAALAAFGKAPDNPTLPAGSRCMVVTNSDTFPPDCCRKSKYASHYIAKTILSLTYPQSQMPAPPGMWNVNHNPAVRIGASGNLPAVDYTQSYNDWFMGWNNLWILSFRNIDVGGSGRADHIYQSKVVLPLVIENIVVPRWKASTGGSIVGV